MHNGKYQCHMAASCTYHLSSSPTLSCSTRAIQKSLTLNKKCSQIFWKKSGEWTISRKWQNRESKRSRQINMTGDRKGELNDSPEIWHPQPPFRLTKPNNRNNSGYFYYRAQELCESQGGHPGLFILMSLMDFCGCKAILNHAHTLVSACP